MSILDNRIVKVFEKSVILQLEGSKQINLPKSQIYDPYSQGEDIQPLDPIKFVSYTDGSVSIAKQQVTDNRLRSLKELSIPDYMKNPLKKHYKQFRKIKSKNSFFKAFSLCILENLFRPDLDKRFANILKKHSERAQELIIDESHRASFLRVEEFIQNIHSEWNYNTSVHNCLSDSLFDTGLVYYSKYLLLSSLENEELPTEIRDQNLFREVLSTDCEIQDVYFNSLSKLLEIDMYIILTSTDFQAFRYLHGATGVFHLFQYADNYYPLVSRESYLFLNAKEIDMDFYKSFLNCYKEQNRLANHNFGAVDINPIPRVDDSRSGMSDDTNQLKQNLEEIELNRKFEQRFRVDRTSSCHLPLEIAILTDTVSILPHYSIHRSDLSCKSDRENHAVDKDLELAVKTLSKNSKTIEYTPDLDRLKRHLMDGGENQDLLEKFPLLFCDKCQIASNDVVNLPCKHRICFKDCQEILYECTNGYMILNDLENFKSDPCCPICDLIFDSHLPLKNILGTELYLMYLEESKNRALSKHKSN